MKVETLDNGRLSSNLFTFLIFNIQIYENDNGQMEKWLEWVKVPEAITVVTVDSTPNHSPTETGLGIGCMYCYFRQKSNRF